MNKLNIGVPISKLSLGQVSLNILKELYARKFDAAIFPYGNVDISAFTVDDGFKAWLQDCINNRYQKLDRKSTTLKCWHLNGSENRLSDKQVLYTFHETDTMTNEELAIVKHQDHVIFSSAYSRDIAKINGMENVSHASLGVDPEVYDLGKTLFSKEITHWCLIGKAEMRKSTQRIINNWVKLYGNNRKHQLTLLINNPFFNAEQNAGVLHHALGGMKFFNVNAIGELKTNKEVNNLMNSIDIDLSGLSMGEGWGLPAFNATALGKWSIVNHVTGHKDWANEKNSIILKPTSKIPCYDGIFFNPNQQFNQGNFWNYTDEQMIDAMARAEKVAKTVNVEGKKLVQDFTYGKLVDAILEKC